MFIYTQWGYINISDIVYVEKDQRRKIVAEDKHLVCKVKRKHREGKEYNDMINRLNRIEGQVRGVKKMVEDDRYCPDILIQVSAVCAALNSFNKVLLSEHINTCVVENIKEGNTEVIGELCQTLQKLMR